MKSISREEGKLLIEIARSVIEEHLRGSETFRLPGDLPDKFREKRGVFVTLEKNGELRGCIGYPEPVMTLIDALIDAAISAATRDPRFPPVEPEELDEIEVEVSVLTPPTPIRVENPSEYPQRIRVGVDGLIVERGWARGLLLPQVATEWGWDAEEFLCNTCMKAGLPPDCFYDPQTRVYRFQAQIFSEKDYR
ncbi:TIGR00296 family protein [Methanothermobacter sp.]|uniref:TIGR00296 family protein n=1 Tax=Methanothermobacter sp. TaxID=1884223 RepID=UPI002619F11F|nr:TIGR00296 family protein [Methanothermobacter sp.]MDI9614264.1 TIGR00296 family protein [Methanothermobacter sp.]